MGSRYNVRGVGQGAGGRAWCLLQHADTEHRTPRAPSATSLVSVSLCLVSGPKSRADMKSGTLYSLLYQVNAFNISNRKP